MTKKLTAQATYPILAALARIGLTPEELQGLARQTDFQKRAARKLGASYFAAAVMAEAVRGSPSYNDLAASHEAAGGACISRQAIAKRMTRRVGKVVVCCAQHFMTAILAWIVAVRLSGGLVVVARAVKRFRRVILQDSTVMRLPTRLFGEFSGVSNGKSKVCNARIQTVYDLRSSRFQHFSVDPYSKNDASAAAELQLRRGDLVLRDRGYLSGEELARHQAAGADCIYRHRHGTAYLDPQTRKPLNLVKILDRDNRLDMEVLLSSDPKTKVRLVAAPVDQETAHRRRLKLKQESKGHAPSKENLQLQNWTIFVTTVAAEILSFQDLLEIYGLRWRIENIFKTWKSELSFAEVHAVSAQQLRVLLMARLAVATLYYHAIYHTACPRIAQDYGRTISLMKLIRYLARYPKRVPKILRALRDTEGPQPVLLPLARHCTYERRRRLTFAQKVEQLTSKGPLS